MKSRNLCLLGLGLALACASVGESRAAEKPIAWRGLGVRPCKEFLERVAIDQDFEAFFFSWAEGFVSGINADRVRRDARVGDLAGRPAADQQKQIRDYCAAHPDRPYVQAVLDMFDSLPAR